MEYDELVLNSKFKEKSNKFSKQLHFLCNVLTLMSLSDSTPTHICMCV